MNRKNARTLGRVLGILMGVIGGMLALAALGGCAGTIDSWFTAPSPVSGKQATDAQLVREARAAEVQDQAAIADKAAGLEREKREAELRRKQRAAEVQRAAAKITGDAKSQVEELFATLAIEDETRDGKLQLLAADLESFAAGLKREAEARNAAYTEARATIAQNRASVDAIFGTVRDVATGGAGANGAGGLLGIFGLGSVGSVIYAMSQRAGRKSAEEKVLTAEEKAELAKAEAEENEAIARKIVNAVDRLRQRAPEVAAAMKTHKDAIRAALGEDAAALVESERVAA